MPHFVFIYYAKEKVSRSAYLFLMIEKRLSTASFLNKTVAIGVKQFLEVADLCH